VRGLSQRRPREGGDPYAVPPMLRMMSNSLLHGRVASMNAWGYGSPPSRGRRSENPHCEPTGRANARPMTGSATQSMRQQKARVDCFVAPLLAMTARYSSAFSRRDAPEFCLNFPPSSIKGRSATRRGEQGMPGARRARSRAMVLTVSFALSLVTGLSCHHHWRNLFRQFDASVGASGPHDFAVRAQRHSSFDMPRPPHPAPRP
jgi:hypothetical protein